MLNKVNIHDPKTLLLLAATVGVGGAVAYHYSRPQPKMIQATIQCHCGKVKGNICAPMESTPAAGCHCNDCLTFVSWMNDEKKSPVDVSSSNGGVDMLQFFKDEVKWSNGSEHIQRVNLRPGTPLLRLYASCCNTPLGLTLGAMKSYPMLVFYRDNIQYSTEERFQPMSWRMNVWTVPKEKRTWDTTCTVSEHLSGGFIYVTLMRFLYGIAAGRNKPDPLDAISAEVEVVASIDKKE